MPLDKIKLQISTPTEPIVAGRGFYQLEEDCLFVQVGQHSSRRRFFSYLESDTIRFDIDKSGKLIFIELVIPRKQWLKTEGLYIPDVIEPADIRWMDFRGTIQSPLLLTNDNKSKLKIRFQENRLTWNYYLSENIIAEINKQDELAAIWITDIIDDMGGREIQSFRRKYRLSKSYII